MPLPSIYDAAYAHMSSSRPQMEAAGLPEATIRHIERLRDMHAYWLQFPNKRDRDIVAELRHRYGIGDTVARQDLRLLKNLIGDIEKVSKAYMRHHVTQMLERAYEKAEAANNTRDMVAAAKALKEVHQLDQDDERKDILETIAPVILDFTDDPTTLGLTRMPDFRQKIKAMKEKHFTEITQDVEYEEVDAQLDDKFPKPPQSPAYGSQDSEGLS